MNRPGSRTSAGSDWIPRSSSTTNGRTSARPPTRPDSGEAMMLRTRSWSGEGSRPAPATASATAAVSRTPRSWTLPRTVSSSVPLPCSVAA